MEFSIRTRPRPPNPLSGKNQKIKRYQDKKQNLYDTGLLIVAGKFLAEGVPQNQNLKNLFLGNFKCFKLVFIYKRMDNWFDADPIHPT